MNLRDEIADILEDRYGHKVTTWGNTVTGENVTVDINAGTTVRILDKVVEMLPEIADRLAVDLDLVPYAVHTSLNAAFESVATGDES